MRNNLFWTLVTLCLTYPTLARAACGLSLTANNISINWTATFSYIAVQLTVGKVGPVACDYGIGFTKGGAGTYLTRRGADAGKQIRYQIYKDNALSKVLKDIPDITTVDDVVQGGFQVGANMTQSINYYFEIPYTLAVTPSLIPAGTYIDTFTANLYEGSDPLGFITPVDNKSVSLTINVPSLIALSIVNSGGGFTEGQTTGSINFGTLNEGQSAAMDLRVRTNAGFNVTFSSLNNGNMKHSNPLSNSLVPYKFYVNGALLNMSNSAAVPVSGLTAAGQTSLSGLAFPMKFVVGNVTTTGKLAGTHADVITITATTTE